MLRKLWTIIDGKVMGTSEYTLAMLLIGLVIGTFAALCLLTLFPY